MQRLGTESAFEVLAHARRLESAGHSVIHLEIGRASCRERVFVGV
jgi:hypothetical protein